MKGKAVMKAMMELTSSGTAFDEAASEEWRKEMPQVEVCLDIGKTVEGVVQAMGVQVSMKGKLIRKKAEGEKMGKIIL